MADPVEVEERCLSQSCISVERKDVARFSRVSYTAVPESWARGTPYFFLCVSRAFMEARFPSSSRAVPGHR